MLKNSFQNGCVSDPFRFVIAPCLWEDATNNMKANHLNTWLTSTVGCTRGDWRKFSCNQRGDSWITPTKFLVSQLCSHFFELCLSQGR